MNSTRSPISLELLGSFRLAHKGATLDLAYEKGRALLAFLALQAGRTYTRAYLAELLWPDLERATALANLRLVLHNLRPLINRESDAENPLLLVTRDAVALQVNARMDIDVLRFLAPTPACASVAPPKSCPVCLADMADCAALYRGELLQGLALPDCPEFEDWLSTQREAVLQRALARLTQLSDAYEAEGAHTQALPFAQRFLALDPWNEHGSRRVMRLLAQCGQHDAALAHLERWSRVVHDELGLLPSQETLALADTIRNHALPKTGRRSSDGVEQATSPPTALPAQRRQVTVLHCALEMGGDEDPDVALAQLHGPQQRCSEIIRAYAGFLVQAHGGSLLAYFGYPHAIENSARQAVRAALALRNERFTGLTLSIGVHTGMVISGGKPDVPDAIGAASNVAIRLRHQVGNNEIAISRATHRLVAGYFECTGPTGDVFCVQQESGARDRLEAAVSLTPMIGRTQELDTLRTLWRQAQGGNPRAVLLLGDAGIGKSRMVLALKQGLQAPAVATTELRCAPEYSQTPFHPLIALFQDTMGFVPTDSAQIRSQKLAQYVKAEYPSEQDEVHALLANLLSLPLAEPESHTLTTTPRQRERTLQIVLDRLYAMAQPRPVLLVVEDLHWADPSSLELLKRVIAHPRPGSWMAVMTARPDFSAPWESERCVLMPLDPLDNKEARALIEAVVPNLPAKLASSIVERADGIPLFVEELAKELTEHDHGAIPSSLQDLLTTRLDALGATKVVAQHAATIGRVFTLEFLCRISSVDAQAVEHGLRQLRMAGLLHPIGTSTFQFGHALLRDAAYQSQTRPERQATHLRIATALESDADVRPELLAQHWSAGGKLHEAVRCWLAASHQAHQQSAHQEVILHCQAGLALLAEMADDFECNRLERELQVKLGASLCATQGYTCAPGAAAYTRAVALYANPEQEPSSDLFLAMWGLWASASHRINYHHSHELAQELQRVALLHGDPIHIQQADFAQGVTHFRQGRLQGAQQKFLQVQGLYTPAQHPIHVARFGEDVGVTNGSHLSGALWLMGHAGQSAQTSAQTLAYARRLEHPYSLAYALTYAMLLHCNMRQPAACLALADETMELAQQHGFSLWQMGAALLRGWAMAQLQMPQGVELMQQCVVATRSALGSVEVMALEPLAHASLCVGRADWALAAIEEAFATGSAKADYHLDAELHRLQGEALLMQSPSNTKQAMQCFEAALHISQQQQAKAFELRAATSMARLWKKKRKALAAHTLLSGVVGTFSDGFDLPDMKEACNLLAQLSAA